VNSSEVLSGIFHFLLKAEKLFAFDCRLVLIVDRIGLLQVLKRLLALSQLELAEAYNPQAIGAVGRVASEVS